MSLRKVVIDTNLYIAWLNQGQHAQCMTGAGLVRYLSSVVQMELRAGAVTLPARRAVDQLTRAYRASNRLLVPDAEAFDQAGRLLQSLRQAGGEVRRASLVNDVLIAVSARTLGATVLTADEDFSAIHGVLDFKLEQVAPL